MKKAITLFFCVLLVSAVLAGTVVGILSDGFRNWERFGQEANVPDPNLGCVTDGDGNALLPGKVYPMPEKMLFTSSTFSADGSSGITLEAAVIPEGATDKTGDWQVAWKNPSSAWASGKRVEDYISLTPLSDGSLITTVSCIQAFGEPAEITVTSRDNPNAKAHCSLDFGQKVIDATLKFGGISVQLGGETKVKYEVNPNGAAPGGTTNASFTTNDVYTVSDTFTTSVKIEPFESGIGLRLKGHVITTSFPYGEELTGSGLYFDYRHDINRWFILSRNGDVIFEDLSTSAIVGYFSEITDGRLFKVVLTVTGKYSAYTAESTIVCDGYTNHAQVTGMAINRPSIVL